MKKVWWWISVGLIFATLLSWATIAVVVATNYRPF